MATLIRMSFPTNIGAPAVLSREDSFGNIDLVSSSRQTQILASRHLEETGVTMVKNEKKIIARKGTKQVEAVTTVERGGTLVSMALAVSANGNSVPPFFPMENL
ncbi:hypothetical protein AVEN_138016-1 [Araneus ventricosus]|uniref:Uncharacterized protein n=1 Tax=Araneus ventricosus TaxID=182803 RepID=A0A4Y2LBD9_ARAVE|nr:hypothetical protein AVEN_138016-1 [Araneus ventricosus]